MTFSPTVLLTVICLTGLLIGGHIYTAIKYYFTSVRNLKSMNYLFIAGLTVISTTAVAANFVIEITKL